MPTSSRCCLYEGERQLTSLLRRRQRSIFYCCASESRLLGVAEDGGGSCSARPSAAAGSIDLAAAVVVLKQRKTLRATRGARQEPDPIVPPTLLVFVRPSQAAPQYLLTLSTRWTPLTPRSSAWT